jgi:tRNA1Val (adenine37-N6)-methyltransferase
MTQGDLTLDGVCRGFLHLWQPQRGYRFNLDGVLLAALAAGLAQRHPRVVDAGAGVGLVGLYVAKHAAENVLLVERQAPLVTLCARNVAHNQLGNAYVVHGDFRALPVEASSVDLVVSNPPYARTGTGRVSPNPVKRQSREALHGGAQEVLNEAERVLSATGRLVMVLPQVGAAQLQVRALQLRRRVDLCATHGATVQRVLLEYARQPGPCTVETRAVHESGGRLAPWVLQIVEGQARVMG